MRRPVSLGASERTTVSTSGSSGTRLGIEKNIVPVGLHREYIQFDGGIKIVFAGAAIVCPFMPGTDHHIVLDISLPDRSAGVRANTAQRVQLARDIADRVRIVSQ